MSTIVFACIIILAIAMLLCTKALFSILACIDHIHLMVCSLHDRIAKIEEAHDADK